MIDNTNTDIDVRSKWVELAAKHSVPIRCVHFTAPAELCEHNDVVRALNSTVCQPPQSYQSILCTFTYTVAAELNPCLR